MMSNSMKLRINKNYQKMFPRPNRIEYKSIKEDMKKNGQLIPIYINKKNEILDGYTRQQICRELKIKPKTEQKNLKSELEEINFILSVNFARRHLTEYQKYIACAYLEEYALKFNKKFRGQDTTKNAKKSPIGHSVDYVAKASGISGSTIGRIRYINKHGKSSDLQELADAEPVMLVYQRVVSRKRDRELRQKSDEDYRKVKKFSKEKKIDFGNIKSGQRITCPECGGTGKITI